MIGFDVALDEREEVEPWMRIFHTITTSDPHNRIVILERKDGCFSFALERWYPPYVEDGYDIHGYWAHLGAGASIYETAEIAEREARAQHKWLFLDAK
jgi:hypothetical protein